jgi:cytochrome c peroxidase
MSKVWIGASRAGVLVTALACWLLPTQQSRAADDASVAKAQVRRTLQLPDTPYRYAEIELPAHFKNGAARRADNTPRSNPVTDAGATLGRVLFYDTRLSANNTTACASCHEQKHAFASPQRFNKGHEGKQLDRNAMSLVNLRYYGRGRFFWDERARSLEEQVLMPIQSKTELGQDLDRLTKILAADKTYPELFRKAFGDSQVTKDRIAKALAQFLRSLVSYQSKFDEGLAKAESVRANFANFTEQENRGKSVFLRSCAVCHMGRGQEALLFMNRPTNNGLDADYKTADGGVGDITLRGSQVGHFKSPSLRNVELTAPYMHDGRFATLEEVIDHYRRGVKRHPNLDGRVRRSRGIRDAEKAALVTFLKTLTDTKFTTDPKFSNPFKDAEEVSSRRIDDRRGRDRGRGGPGRGGRGRGFGPRGLTEDQIVERIMSFDKNKDGKITKDELPERMQFLLEMGDTNKDGALDKDEIKKLAAKLREDGRVREFDRGRGPGPFGGRGGPEGRFGPGGRVERAVDDLNLADKKKDAAKAAVKTNQEDVRKLMDLARAGLLVKMQEVLSAEEFKKFKEALDRRPDPARDGRGPFGGRGGPARGRGGLDGGLRPADRFERAVDDLNLADKKKDAAKAAVKTHQENVRKLVDLARAGLLMKMQDVLSADEFKKFKEALDRRPDPPPDRRGGRGRGFGRGLSADEIVERLLTFDKNKDGKLTKDELPERMQHLIEMGDTNKDGALDKEEIKKLAAKLAEDDSLRDFGGPRGRGRTGRGRGPDR